MYSLFAYLAMPRILYLIQGLGMIKPYLAPFLKYFGFLIHKPKYQGLITVLYPVDFAQTSSNVTTILTSIVNFCVTNTHHFTVLTH